MYTKRDVSTGKHDPAIKFGNEGNWLGAIGYFTVLHQMSSCYCPANGSRTLNNATILSAIEDFGFDLLDHDQHQLNALIALRNAFTHDFNLLNIPQNHKKKSHQQPKFTVIADLKNTWVVKLPSKLWDGDIEKKDFYDVSDTTFVNLFGFANLVETVYSKILEINQKGE